MKKLWPFEDNCTKLKMNFAIAKVKCENFAPTKSKCKIFAPAKSKCEIFVPAKSKCKIFATPFPLAKFSRLHFHLQNFRNTINHLQNFHNFIFDLQNLHVIFRYFALTSLDFYFKKFCVIIYSLIAISWRSFKIFRISTWGVKNISLYIS